MTLEQQLAESVRRLSDGETIQEIAQSAKRQKLSRDGIGGSEIAAACGFSKWRSRFGLWLEKTGRAESFTGNLHTRLGTLCEPHALQLYTNATGHAVVTPPESVFHPEHSWARATPDGQRVDDPLHLVQVKCVGYFVGRRWRSEIPVEVEAQCQWEMFVTGAQRNDLAALVGSDELEWERFVLGEAVDPEEIFRNATLEIRTIYRSEADIETLFRGASEFMEMVRSDTQPPVDHSPECTKWLNRKAGGLIELDYDDEASDIAGAVDEYQSAYVAQKAAESRLDLAKNRVRKRLGDAGATRIRTPAGPIQWIAKRDGSTQLRAPEAWGKEF